jgi:hypothetical protein
MVARRQRGETYAAIAAHHGVTTERVRQICARIAAQERAASAKQQHADMLLGAPIEVLDLEQRVYNALKRSQIATVGELVQRSPTEMESLRNLGAKSLSDITAALAKHGLSLAADKPIPPPIAKQSTPPSPPGEQRIRRPSAPEGLHWVLFSDAEIWDLQHLLRSVCPCNGHVTHIPIPLREVVHALELACDEALEDATLA